MPTVKLTIPAAPEPQGRPKFARMGNHVTTYDPTKSKQYKALVAQYARQQWRGLPVDGPILLRVAFYRPLQKSLSAAQRLRRQRGWDLPVVKPDLDNYFKAVTDALKGICWKDDSGRVWIETLEGTLLIKPSDWILTGVNGEHWPVADDIFRKTYQPLPVIPKVVGEYIRAKKRKNPSQTAYYLLRDTNVLWRRNEGSELLSWMHDHPDEFALAWLLDDWEEEETR